MNSKFNYIHSAASNRSARSFSLVHAWVIFFVLLTFLALIPQSSQAIDWKALNPFSEKEDPFADVVNPHWFSTRVVMPDTDEDLVKLVENRSLLFTTTNEPIAGSIGLLNQAASDFENIVGILYSQSYYGGLVDITLDGKLLEEYRPTDTFENKSKENRVKVVVTINPGAKFTLGEVSVTADPIAIDPSTFGLVSGAPAKSDDIFAAQADVLNMLEALGYPLANVSEQNIVADHDTNKLDVIVTIDTVGKASYDQTKLVGNTDMLSDFTLYMLDLEKGELYDPDKVKLGTSRLRNLDVYSSVVLDKADKLTDADLLPMTLTVTERKKRVIGGGATFSSIDGFGIEGYWTHRNLFGKAERLELSAGINRIGKASGIDDYNADFGIMYKKPGVFSPDANFISSLNAEQTIDDDLKSQLVNWTNRIEYIVNEHQRFSSGTAVEYSQDERLGDTTSYLIASAPTEYRWDYRDDVLNPTKGFQAIAGIEPGYEIKASEPFVKVGTEISAYQSLDEENSWIIAARIALGSYVYGGDSLPSNRRFYSGGGGSVRGYGYRRIGPKDADDKELGGISLVEGSFEVRKNITESIQIVPFVDMGAVSNDRSPAFDDLQYGAGLGLRYLTPIGPLRFDVGVPLNKEPGEDDYGIYIGIGQSF